MKWVKTAESVLELLNNESVAYEIGKNNILVVKKLSFWAHLNIKISLAFDSVRKSAP